MKRDFELVRLILLELEGEEPVDLSPYSKGQIEYHELLIYEAGFAEGKATGQFDSPAPISVVLRRLTWEGHELLDKIRSKTTWNAVKSLLKEKGISLSFEALKMAVSIVIHKQLG